MGKPWSGLPYDPFSGAAVQTRISILELVFYRWQDSERSALCSTWGSTLVTSGTRSWLPTLTVRLTPEEKRQFVELATRHGLSEAALALVAIRAVLAPGGANALTIPTLPAREPATDRVTIRLRPGDGAALDARAAQRGVKASTYLAALVRAHLGASPILTADELHTVKQAVVVLAGVGRVLSRIARSGAQGSPLPAEVRQALAQTRCVLATVEERTSDLARAALRSWESRYE